ncbi:hypothetical protein [Mycoplasma sp. E35C]|uniref:hypothetical protein n=1 Tax=Mycoplasma sp. E35C TaxID=2801918 RepID=UPI001CA404E5|nr:hypothetical protein [Mycoplasma sp. E35C]QZX48935.1 hypothetical protein JJE79_02660 [Mycoplasma sp. E35C]
MYLSKKNYDYWHLYQFKQLKIPLFFMIMPFVNVSILIKICAAWSALFIHPQIKKRFHHLPTISLLIPTILILIMIPIVFFLIPWLINNPENKESTFNLTYNQLIILNVGIYASFSAVIIALNLILAFLTKRWIWSSSIKFCDEKIDLDQKAIDLYYQHLLHSITYGLGNNIFSYFKPYNAKLAFVMGKITSSERFNNWTSDSLSARFLTGGFTSLILPLNYTLFLGSFTYVGFVKSCEKILNKKILTKKYYFLYFYWTFISLIYLVAFYLPIFDHFSLTFLDLNINSDLRILFNWAPFIVLLINCLISGLCARSIRLSIQKTYKVEKRINLEEQFNEFFFDKEMLEKIPNWQELDIKFPKPIQELNNPDQKQEIQNQSDSSNNQPE